MRHLSDEDLARYFDDGTQDKRPSGSQHGGWSMDDAFANPKQTRAVISQPPPESNPATPVPLKRPQLSDRPLRPVSKVSNLPPLASEDELTWTGRDMQPRQKGGNQKMMFMLLVALGSIAVFVMLAGGDTGTQFPQIGR
ncbi:MAG: hypothetical protein AAF762_09610 [Pseudomonadota bacterium]